MRLTHQIDHVDGTTTAEAFAGALDSHLRGNERTMHASASLIDFEDFAGKGRAHDGLRKLPAHWAAA